MYCINMYCINASNTLHLNQRGSLGRRLSVMSLGSAFGLPVETGLCESGVYAPYHVVAKELQCGFEYKHHTHAFLLVRNNIMLPRWRNCPNQAFFKGMLVTKH